MFVRKPHFDHPASDPSLATLQSTNAPTEGNTAKIKRGRPRRTLQLIETGPEPFARHEAVDFHHNILNTLEAVITRNRSLKANLLLISGWRRMP